MYIYKHIFDYEIKTKTRVYLVIYTHVNMYL